MKRFDRIYGMKTKWCSNALFLFEYWITVSSSSKWGPGCIYICLCECESERERERERERWSLVLSNHTQPWTLQQHPQQYQNSEVVYNQKTSSYALIPEHICETDRKVRKVDTVNSLWENSHIIPVKFAFFDSTKVPN